MLVSTIVVIGFSYQLDATEIGLFNIDAQGKLVGDQCRASCGDWYGNARPLFLRDRVFALLGYELVEGKLDHGRMIELRRISYARQATQSSH